MIICQAENYREISRKAANIVSAQIIMKPNAVLGLATGSSPIGVYRQLIEWYHKGDLDFSEVTTINLDEYIGLGPQDKQSYRYFMDNNLFNHININKSNTYLPNGLETDTAFECERYNDIIKSAGNIDLQLLGIGHNGHIGFNEPGVAFEKETHLVELSEDTIEANSRFFDDLSNVPRKAYSMGIKNIMSAKKILLIAAGVNKAKAVYNSFFGPIMPAVPASILQLHRDVTVVADKEALSIVKEKGLI